MRRYIILSLLALLTIVTVYAQEVAERKNFDHRDLRYYGGSLKGDIESIAVTHYYESGESQEVTYKFNQRGDVTEVYGSTSGVFDSDKGVFSYDDNGNTIEVIRYNGDELTSRYTHAYDAEGREIEYAEYDADGSLEHRTTTTYDTQGRKTEMVWSYYYESSPSNCRNVYIYDDNGNITEFTQYSVERDEVFRSEIYRYNDQGELEARECYNHKNIMTVKVLYSTICEGDNLLTEITTYHYFNDGSLFMFERSIYDDNDMLLRTESYNDAERLVQTEIYEYDVERRNTKIICFGTDGSLTSQHLHIYDADGRKVEERVTRGDSSLQIHRLYTYDSMGNVVEFETFDFTNTIPEHIISKYEIVYR